MKPSLQAARAILAEAQKRAEYGAPPLTDEEIAEMIEREMTKEGAR